jgi:predicted Zn-dependent peptidase
VKSLIALVLLAAACGPATTTTQTITLPGDGSEHTAKPRTPTAPPRVDPWSGKELFTAPPAKPAAPVVLPPIETFTLKNGLRVFAIASDRLPVLSFQVAVKAGRRQEPRSRVGVAELTADMLVRGTKKHNWEAFAKAIEIVGGTIATDATYEATVLSCSVLARDASTCLSLVPEMLTQPTFPEDILVDVRGQFAGREQARLNDLQGLASAHVQNLLWGPQHVRGWAATGEAISNLRRDDLVAWHKTWFVPGNTLLVVSGDFQLPALKKDLERAFGGWKATPVPPTPSYPESGLSGSRIRLVDRPGAPQAYVQIAQYGIAHDDPQFFDALVWNHALGAGTSSRLDDAFPVESGKSFGAGSSFDRNADRGSLVAQAVVRPTDAIAAAKTILAELDKMSKEGPTQAEIDAAKSTIAGGYGTRFQSAAAIGAALIGAELHGFGKEYLANYAVALDRVDLASAKKSAATILTPSAYVMVIVGDAKDLEPQLTAAGWRYQKVPFNVSLAPPVDTTSDPVPAVDPKLAAAAKKLLAQAITAKGGRKKLEALKNFRMSAQGTTTIEGQLVPVVIERLLIVPDKMRIDATLGGKVTISVAVDGNKGWQVAPDQTGQQMQLTEIGGDSMASVDFERWREPELILLRAEDPSAGLSTAPDEVVNGKKHSVLTLHAPVGNITVKLFLDKKTKLVSRMTYREGNADEVDDFSNYKSVSGLKIAHARHSTGGDRETKLELTKVTLDGPWDPKEFAKPTAAPAPATP